MTYRSISGGEISVISVIQENVHSSGTPCREPSVGAPTITGGETEWPNIGLSIIRKIFYTHFSTVIPMQYLNTHNIFDVATIKITSIYFHTCWVTSCVLIKSTSYWNIITGVYVRRHMSTSKGWSSSQLKTCKGSKKGQINNGGNINFFINTSSCRVRNVSTLVYAASLWEVLQLSVDYSQHTLVLKFMLDLIHKLFGNN